LSFPRTLSLREAEIQIFQRSSACLDRMRMSFRPNELVISTKAEKSIKNIIPIYRDSTLLPFNFCLLTFYPYMAN
jgi:hypothetical protein